MILFILNLFLLFLFLFCWVCFVLFCFCLFVCLFSPLPLFLLNISQNNSMPWVGRDLANNQNPICFGQTCCSPEPSTQGPIQPLDSSRDGTFRASLSRGSLCLSIHWVKNFFLTSNLNFPSFSLKLFILVWSLSDYIKSHSHPAYKLL